MPEHQKHQKTRRNSPACPFCGSRHIAVYLRGMPRYSEELMQAIEEGEIILGGCCVSDNDPRYYCHDCKKEFGRPPVFFRNKDPQRPDDIIAADFLVGGYFDGYDNVLIRSSGDERAVCVVNPQAGYALQPLFIRALTAREWNALKKLLFDQCFIHEWKKSYIDPYVCDGTQWEITLSFRNGRKYRIGGSNAFPGTWEKLNRYIKKWIREANTVSCSPAEMLRYAYLFRKESLVYPKLQEYLSTFSDRFLYGDRSLHPDRIKDRDVPVTYTVCFVAYQHGGKEYTYLDRKKECQKGDVVAVPVGSSHEEIIGEVTAVGEFTKDNMPYPLEKMKSIIGKIETEVLR